MPIIASLSACLVLFEISLGSVPGVVPGGSLLLSTAFQRHSAPQGLVCSQGLTGRLLLSTKFINGLVNIISASCYIGLPAEFGKSYWAVLMNRLMSFSASEWETSVADG